MLFEDGEITVRGAVLIISVILVGLIGFNYYLVDQRIGRDIDLVSLNLMGVTVEDSDNNSLSKGVDLVFLISNPSQKEYIVSIDFDVDFIDTYIVSYSVDDLVLEPVNMFDIHVQSSISGSSNFILDDLSDVSNYHYEGDISMSTKFLGLIELSVSRRFSR